MKKPFWKTITNPVEENQYYIVVNNEDKSFTVYHKTKDTVFRCKKYAIAGSTLIYTCNSGEIFLYNEDHPQKFGQGNVEAIVMELSSWGYKAIDGKNQLVVKYKDEKGYNFIRLVDEEGNLHKRAKKKKENIETEVVSL